MIPIYLFIAMNVPKWFLKAINKINRGFLWQGREQANGGCCLVAWKESQDLLILVAWVFLIWRLCHGLFK
ncbi:hypothetical protein PR202_gb29418 [Eleusine coracana subsp. coracana]|uniref:Uncharacterized protein n=1 Tax=Eleusine coracana subsp. coracana TaxID=191504 RepID=A0AAV5FZD3_ELECO|nr:hypothetical protein PR202_gb29418 [Eleusine coracana subsp. coracana]